MEIRHVPTGVFLVLALVAACCLSTGCLHAEKTALPENRNASVGITRYMGVFGGTSFIVFGKLQNTGDVPLEKVVLVVDFLDTDRKKVDSRAVAAPAPIPVNGSWDFEVSLDGPPATEVRYYEIRALFA